MRYKKFSVYDQKSINPETVSLDTATNNDLSVPVFIEGYKNYNIDANELASDKKIVSTVFNLNDFDDIMPDGKNGWNSWSDHDTPNIKDLDEEFGTENHSPISDNNKTLLKNIIDTYNYEEITEEGKNYKTLYLKVPVKYTEAGFLAEFDNNVLFNLTNSCVIESSIHSENIERYIFQFSTDNYTHTARIVPDWNTTKTKVNTAYIQFVIKAEFEIVTTEVDGETVDTKTITDITEFKIVGDYIKEYSPDKNFRINYGYDFALPIKSTVFPNITTPLTAVAQYNSPYINIKTRDEFSPDARKTYTYCGTQIESDALNNVLKIKDVNTVNCPYYRNDELLAYIPIQKSIFGENMTSMDWMSKSYCRNFDHLDTTRTFCIDYRGGSPTIYQSDITLLDYSTVYIDNRFMVEGNIFTQFNINVSAEFIGNFFGNSFVEFDGTGHPSYFSPIIGAFSFNRYFPSKFRRTYEGTTVATYLTSASTIFHAQNIGLAIKGHYDPNHLGDQDYYNLIPYNLDSSDPRDPYIKTQIQLNGMNNQQLIRNDTLSTLIKPDEYYTKVTVSNQNYDTLPCLLRADNIKDLNWKPENPDGSSTTTDSPYYVNSIKIVGALKVNCLTPATAL